ncbi:adenosine kinase [Alphaproteobacteria bacterium]|nr:adenosine kinase [Alphaproteobacteria bacterium]
MIAETSDKFLKDMDIPKGGMQLIDTKTADNLIVKIKKPVIISGGSAANTAVGFCSFGGSACFIGQTGSDEFGDLFSKDINKSNVFFQNKPSNLLEKTSKSIILVTPDAERSMNTFLGASVSFNINCINEDQIINSKLLYIEGYLFDQPEAKKAIYHCCKLAQDKNIQIVLSLSDLFCVERHRDDFHNLINEYIDIIFANEEEIKSLYQSTLNKCVELIKHEVTIGAITLGSEGSIVFENQNEYVIKPIKIERPIDTTGAGDLFASGFLYGYINKYSTQNCGVLGTKAAAEIIKYYGARPKILLENLIDKDKLF